MKLWKFSKEQEERNENDLDETLIPFTHIIDEENQAGEFTVCGQAIPEYNGTMVIRKYPSCPYCLRVISFFRKVIKELQEPKP